MEWLPFALVAYFVWSFSNLFSKIIISQYVGSITVNLILFGIWNLLPLVLIPFKGLSIPEFEILALAIGSGILYLCILIPYFKALAIEEASRVVPLWRFTPLFILLFSSEMTGETLDVYQFAAFLLLVLGGFLVSVKRLTDLFRPSKAFYLMIGASFLSALYSSIAKLIYLRLPYYESFTLMRLGVAISVLALLMLPHNRRELRATVASMQPRIKQLVILNGILEFVGLIFYNFAVSRAPVALVSASAGIQAIFVLIFSILLSMRFPQLIHEDMSRSALVQKGVAIALIMVGTGIISLHAQ